MYTYFVILSFITVIMLVLINAIIIKENHREKNFKKKLLIVRETRFSCYAFMIFILLFVMAAILITLENKSVTPASIAFMVFVVLLFLFLLGISRKRIILNIYDKYLLYTPVLGRTKMILISDIKKVKELRRGRKTLYDVYNNTYFFKFSNSLEGYQELLKYFKNHNIKLELL